jgi:hypothetical protein
MHSGSLAWLNGGGVLLGWVSEEWLKARATPSPAFSVTGSRQQWPV